MTRAVQNLLLPLLGGAENVYTANKVENFGTRYWQGCGVVTGINEVDLPNFGIVELICIIDGGIYFVCQLTSTVEYNEHLHACILTETNIFSLKSPAQLADCYPLGIYTTTDNRKLVVKRHHI